MRVLWITLVVLVLDHVTKVLVKTNMFLGQSIPLVGDWLRLTFTENPGMAFGVTFGVPLLVTVFSILATGAIVLYLWHARTSKLSYRISLAFVLGGALGNIVDRVFYAKIFGYGGLFRGEVVDFVHVNVYNGPAASWIPFIGGQHITLFPIWNVADMAIVCGVVAILLFHRAVADMETSEQEAEQVPTEHAQPALLAVSADGQVDGSGVAGEAEVTASPVAAPVRQPGESTVPTREGNSGEAD